VQCRAVHTVGQNEMLDGGSAVSNHLMLRITMSGNESATSASSNSASDQLLRGIHPAQGRGRDGPTAAEVDNSIKNNKKKRPRVDVESAANPERKLEPTSRTSTAAEDSIRSRESAHGKQKSLLNLAHHGKGGTSGGKVSIVCKVFDIVPE
jgi:hypothetical protein